MGRRIRKNYIKIIIGNFRKFRGGSWNNVGRRRQGLR